MTDTAQPPADAVRRLQWVVAQLREHCPWTQGLTHQRLVEYLIEEAYETVEEVESGGVDDPLRKELGDLLFQIVLHAQLASERASFDLDGVAQAISAKLIRRSPHVFTPDGQLDVDPGADLEEIERAWTRIKAEEKLAETSGGADGTPSSVSGESAELAAVVGSLPAHLPALAKAAKLIDRLDRTLPLTSGRDDDAGQVAQDPLASADEEALGELLFTVVHRSRARGLDPERALRTHLSRLAQGRVGHGLSR